MLAKTGILYLVTSLSSTLAQTNLMQNPGFETGALSPWVGSPAQVLNASNTDGLDFFPHSGEYYVELAAGEGGSSPTTLTQVVSGLGAGPNYILSYYYAIFDEPESTCFLAASLAGDPISSATLYDFDQGSGYRLVNTTFSFPLDGTQSARLEFSLECDEEGVAVIGLDDVSLVYA